jgi:prepilin-type processing-associated H-X9-DG protein
MTSISNFVCPSSGLNAICDPNIEPGANYNGINDRRYERMANYRGCVGTTNSNGMIFRNSSTSHRDARDGVSLTILFGECPVGWWTDAHTACSRIKNPRDPNDASLIALNGWSEPLPASWSPQLIRWNLGFGSWHANIVNFAMVDGSVRSVERSIDEGILGALATRDGSERIDGDF